MPALATALRFRTLRLPGSCAALVVFLLAALAGPAAAGVNAWTSIGPGGGRVLSLIPDPSVAGTVYAGTLSGVFVSTDAAGTWSASSTGIPPYGAGQRPGPDVYDLVADASQPGVLYAATDGAGVFKSSDGGFTWAAANTGLTNVRVRALTLDPTAPGVLYAGTFNGGVFKSVDGGASWNAAGDGLGALTVLALAVDAATPNTVYAGTNGNGVYKTTDGGVTWTSVGPQVSGLQVQAFAVPSAGVVLAGTAVGLFRTLDGGATWASISTLGTSDVTAIVVDPASAATIYVGTFGSGVFRTTNAAVSWQTLNVGLSSHEVERLVLDPLVSGRLYAGTTAGVFKSTDSGSSWSEADLGLVASESLAIVIDPTATGTIYSGSIEGGVVKTTTGGSVWASASQGLSSLRVVSLALDPATPSTLYAGLFGGPLFKTTNGATTWTLSATGLGLDTVSTVVVDRTTPTTVYAGGVGGRTVYKSTTGGTTWSQSANGLPSAQVLALVIDPTNAQVLYAGTNGGGVYTSSDAGATWARTGLTNTAVVALAIDPSAPTTLYAATFGNGVVKSLDGGATWAAINTGLTDFLSVKLVIDPVTPLTLYLATDHGGVFKSADGGASWRTLNNGLPFIYVQSLALDPVTPSVVYAGIDGGGLFQLTQVPATLTVTRSGGGTGTVTGGAIACGATCAAPVDYGVTLTLVASGDMASRFAGWTGCDSVNGAQCTLTVSADRQVAAEFEPDTTPPSVTIASGPSDVLPSHTAAFTWTGTDDGTPTAALAFAYRLDPVESGFGAYAAVTGHSYPGLPDGAYTLYVKARDLAGNESDPVSRAFTIVTPGPDVSITGGPSGVTAATAAGFTWTAVDDFTPVGSLVYAYRLQPLETAFTTFAADTSRQYAGLAEGTYTFEVKARDTDGHESPATATRTFTVDTTPPLVSITSGPAAVIGTPSAAFTWSGSDTTSPSGALVYATRLSPLEAAFQPYAAATARTYGTLATGVYTFSVKARDEAGNESTVATQTFTVDLSAPQVTITSGPSGTILVSTAAFQWSGADNVTAAAGITYATKLEPVEADYSAFGAATARTLAGLANGLYTFRIKARDQVGNEAAPVSRTFTVNADVTPPLVTITGGPTGTITVPTATFTWLGSDDRTTPGSLRYATRLAPVEPALSAFGAPTTRSLAGLANGAYTFSVTAQDETGNQATASRTFTVNAPPTFRLTVARTGTGAGTVSTNPAGVVCPGTCQRDYPTNAQVTLIAAPGAGAVFTGWSGDAVCAGGVVPMYSNRSCTATFEARADLVLTALTAPATGQTGRTIGVLNTVRNNGSVAATAFRVAFFMSPIDNTPGAGVQVGFRDVASLAPNAVSTGTTAITIPIGFNPGNYFVSALADSNSTVTEVSESNNGRTAPAPVAVAMFRADLALTALSAPAAGATGRPLAITSTVRNLGQASATGALVRLYMALGDPTPGAGVMVGSRTVTLAAGGTSTVTTTVTLPANLSVGSYYLSAIADPAGVITEVREDNNAIVAAQPVVVSLYRPDLTMVALGVPATAFTGRPLAITSTARNSGPAPAGAFAITFYASKTDATPGAGIVLGTRAVASLAAGMNSSGTTTVTLPATLDPGAYFVSAVADSAGVVLEVREDNNAIVAAQPVVVSLYRPDLAMVALGVPATAFTGRPLAITSTARNSGPAPAGAFTITFYASKTDATPGAGIVLGTRAVASLAAGMNSSGTTTVTLPATLDPGAYFVSAVADSAGVVLELSETNNGLTAAASMNVTRPDLAVTAVTPPVASVRAGTSAAISTSVVNRAPAGAPTGPFRVGIYLSVSDSTPGAGTLIGFRDVTSLAGGATSTVTTSIPIPAATAAGTYLVSAVADILNAVPEADETNNGFTAAAQLTITH